MAQPDVGMFLASMRDLGNVARWNNRFCFGRESVAEHTAQVGMIALLLCEVEEHIFGHRVDRVRVLEGALLHDLEESITGDVLSPTKHGNPQLRRLLREMEIEAMRNMLAYLPEPLRVELNEKWKRAKDDTYEGQIVEAADKFSALLYAIQELKLGNYSFTKTASRLIQEVAGIPVQSARWLLQHGLPSYIRLGINEDEMAAPLVGLLKQVERLEA